jgi:hypothetical protein
MAGERCMRRCVAAASVSGRLADPEYIKASAHVCMTVHACIPPSWWPTDSSAWLTPRTLLLQEYEALKASLLGTTRKAGGGLAAYLLLAVDGSAALCALLGSAAASVYLLWLFRDVEAYNADSRVPMMEAEQVCSCCWVRELTRYRWCSESHHFTSTSDYHSTQHKSKSHTMDVKSSSTVHLCMIARMHMTWTNICIR